MSKSIKKTEEVASEEASLQKLSPQQAGFVRDWLMEGMSGYDAAIKNGYSHWTAIKITSNLPIGVKTAMRYLLEKRGITLDKLAEVEHQLLNGDDNKAKNKALDRLYKIFGVLKDAGDAPAAGSPPPGGVHVHFHDERVQTLVNNFHQDLRKLYERPAEDTGGDEGGGKKPA